MMSPVKAKVRVSWLGCWVMGDGCWVVGDGWWMDDVDVDVDVNRLLHHVFFDE